LAWEAALEPYSGSQIRTMFPPMVYTVRLLEPEVIAVHRFLLRVSDVLTGSSRAREER
jgi:hypothetical protein